MEKWIFKPTEAIGKIVFGMSRDEVHALFKEGYKVFKKNKFSKNTTDNYGKFHVFYTKDDKVEAVEIFDEIEVYFEERCIYPQNIDAVEEVLGTLLKDNDCYIQKEKEVGLYVPEKKAESILLAGKGYF